MYLKSAFLAFASLLPMCIMAQTEMTTTDLASGCILPRHSVVE